MAEKGGFLMRNILAAVCCLLLLGGCAAPAVEDLPPEADGPAGDIGPAEEAVEYAAALAIPLAELEPYRTRWEEAEL